MYEVNITYNKHKNVFNIWFVLENYKTYYKTKQHCKMEYSTIILYHSWLGFNSFGGQNHEKTKKNKD